jgi:hypothetical protein
MMIEVVVNSAKKPSKQARLPAFLISDGFDISERKDIKMNLKCELGNLPDWCANHRLKQGLVP